MCNNYLYVTISVYVYIYFVNITVIKLYHRSDENTPVRRRNHPLLDVNKNQLHIYHHDGARLIVVRAMPRHLFKAFWYVYKNTLTVFL